MDSNKFCVFKCENVPDNIWLFTEEKLRQCHEKLRVRKTLQMKYSDIDLPDHVTEAHGYHSICCKNFMAISKKSLEKYDQLKKSDDNTRTLVSFASDSGKLNSPSTTICILRVVSFVFQLKILLLL